MSDYNHLARYLVKHYIEVDRYIGSDNAAAFIAEIIDRDIREIDTLRPVVNGFLADHLIDYTLAYLISARDSMNNAVATVRHAERVRDGNFTSADYGPLMFQLNEFLDQSKALYMSHLDEVLTFKKDEFPFETYAYVRKKDK